MKRIVLTVLLMIGAAHAQLVVAPLTAECATSIDGTVVLVPNPLSPPLVATVFSGTLGSGTYFIKFAWYDAATHLTLTSPEVQQALASTGQLQVSPPASGVPSTALGMKVFIGTTSGGETLQGATVSNATFIQSVPLVTGAALPTSNTTVCQIIANDAGWPSGTGYSMSLTTPAGATLPGYPLQVQLLGPGNIINLSAGLPLYNGTVTYPVPILARPYGHGPQSISGPLSFGGYNVTQVGRLGVGTSVPGWGVDAEGSGIGGAVNAQTGYLFAGAAPLNHVLLGNGSYYVDSSTIPASTLSGLFYQTVASNSVAQTQRPTLNFSPYFTTSDSASPAQTTVAPVTTGSEAKLVTAAAAGTSTHCANWDASGGVGDSGAVCPTGVTRSGTVAGCVSSGSPCNVTITWSNGGFPSSTYNPVCFGIGPITGQPQAAWIYGGTQTATTLVVTTDNRGSTNPGGFTTISCIGTTN